MNSCKEINLSVLGTSHEVFDLVGEESLFKVWYFDLTIKLPLNVDVRTWLSQSAKCHFVAENGDQRIFGGEIISVRNKGFCSSEEQIVNVRLCSYLHRFEKSGGIKFFKECCFRDIVFQILTKHHLSGQLEVIFSFDLGADKLKCTQQFSEESDAEFINRFCHRWGWMWLLQTSYMGFDTLYFFKKSEKFMLKQMFHEGIFGDSVSLSNSLIKKEHDFHRRIEKTEDNIVNWEMSSLSPWIALGHRCAPIEDAIVVSIKHYFGVFSELMKVKKYRNQLSLSTSFQYSELILDRLISFSPFQLGFVKSDLPYAEVEHSGDYKLEILSESIVPVRGTHTMSPLLGYGGALSHFSGFSAGIQGLWYNDTEVLLAEVDKCENSLKIFGSIANVGTVNPVMRCNKTTYQWRTARKIVLSFEDGPYKQGISWVTEGIKNSLVIGEMVDNVDNNKRIELKASFGVLHVSGDRGISVFSGEKIKEEVACSKHVVVNNQAYLKNEHNKIHCDSSRNIIFDFRKSMFLKSTKVHWKVTNKFFWSSKGIGLHAGDFLRIKIPSGNYLIEADLINFVGHGKGGVSLSNNTGNAGIYISRLGKITVKGYSVYASGVTTMKGHVNSYIIEPRIESIVDYGFSLELKEPSNLNQMIKNKEAAENFSKKLFDPFDQIIGNECEESGWLNLVVSLNGNHEKLNGMKIEKELRSSEYMSNFVLSKD